MTIISLCRIINQDTRTIKRGVFAILSQIVILSCKYTLLRLNVLQTAQRSRLREKDCVAVTIRVIKILLGNVFEKKQIYWLNTSA